MSTSRLGATHSMYLVGELSFFLWHLKTTSKARVIFLAPGSRQRDSHFQAPPKHLSSTRQYKQAEGLLVFFSHNLGYLKAT
jgi:hypothetical protein